MTCYTTIFISAGEDGRHSVKHDQSSSSVVKKENRVTAGITTMDTSTKEDIGYKEEETFDWLRDCFKDLLTANS